MGQADIETEDKIRILKQNAEQILAVVKETFTGFAFGGGSVQADCEKTTSDGELLDCLWSQASTEVAAGTRSANLKAMPALLEVRLLARSAATRIDRHIVLQTCAGCHE